MDSLLNWIATSLAEQKHWVGPAVFMFTVAESLAVVGAVIPATPVLFLLGTLLGTGEIPLSIVPWAMAGAIGGYWLSWAAGWRFGIGLHRYAYFRRNRRMMARVRLFFRRWGGPTLVFGRYVLGPFQSMLPPVAGIARYEGTRFHAWNILSGCLWVVLVFCPGYLVGRGLLASSPGSGFISQATGLMALVSGWAVVVCLLANLHGAVRGGRGRRN